VLAPDIHHTGLRTNGRAVEIIGDFSVHAEPVEAFLGFFSRITISEQKISAGAVKTGKP
jgi:hypothetical protein